MIVQKLRLQKGWSQAQLAELSGLNVRTIQRIERGDPASNESLKALASVFEMDFNELKNKEDSVSSNTAKIGIAQLNSGLTLDELLAYSRLNRIKSFYSHLIKFVLIVSALAIFNYVKNPSKPWIIWVLVGWGLGILWHAYKTFIRGFNPKWEHRYIEKQLKQASS